MVRKLNVLIVDDNDDIRMALSLLLRELNDCDVTVAPDGLACLELLANEQFDVMFLDYKMPGIDGLGVLQRLRNHDYIRPHYIAIFSASYRGSGLSDAAMNLGADILIPKPFADEQILAALNAAKVVRTQ